LAFTCKCIGDTNLFRATRTTSGFHTSNLT
jgi:hypothetical protein